MLWTTALSLAFACGGSDEPSGEGGSSGDGSGGSGGSAGSAGTGGEGGRASTGGDSAGSGGTSGNTAPSGEVCANAERAGSLGLRLTGGKTIFDGAIGDGITPSSVYREIAAEGGCQLLGPRDLFCSPSCESGMTCAGENACTPTPTKQSAGMITVTGLLASLDVERNGITGGYSKTILDPYPAFEPGAAIQLSAAGDVIAAFTLNGWGVPPLVTSLTTVNVSKGSGVPLTWDTTGVNAEQTEIFMHFSVNVHGATTGWIECSVPDTGSFEIPATLVSNLIDLGLSGFPRMSMSRRSADSTQLPTGDCVDFEISSEAQIELTVDGLVSCSASMPCPEGQTCSTEMACE
jgi:hypothetical protein